MKGNLLNSSISAVSIDADQVSARTTLSLTLFSPREPYSFCNITIPKSAVTYGLTPTAYINNQVAADYGYSQDAGNFYVWYTTYSTTYQLSVVFAGTSDLQILAAVLVSLVSVVLVVIVVAPRIRNKKINSLL
jgi:hypothetical protein